MRKGRHQAAEATEPQHMGDAVDQVISNTEHDATEFDPVKLEAQSRQAAEGQRHAEPAEQGEAPGSHAAAVGKKAYTPPANPFGFEFKRGKGNGVHLLKSEPEERNENGAWVIRFDQKPNEMEGHSKENPHPVIKMLKEEGFRWGFDHDGKGGWGKEWGRDPYGADHDEARRVTQKAAEMVGAQVSHGASVSA